MNKYPRIDEVNEILETIEQITNRLQKIEDKIQSHFKDHAVKIKVEMFSEGSVLVNALVFKDGYSISKVYPPELVHYLLSSNDWYIYTIVEYIKHALISQFLSTIMSEEED